jgi:hypothetical protein
MHKNHLESLIKALALTEAHEDAVGPERGSHLFYLKVMNELIQKIKYDIHQLKEGRWTGFRNSLLYLGHNV